MSKAKELLEKIDAEILDKVNARVMERDAEIKEEAQKAYDAKVEEVIASIKAEVEVEYQVAKNYLNEVLAAEAPEIAEEPVVSEEAHQISTEGMTQMQEQAVQAQSIETHPVDISPAEV